MDGQLHINLQKLLTAAGINTYSSRIAFFAPYILGDKHILTINEAFVPIVKFKLLYPANPIVIFGFHSYDYIDYRDDFRLTKLEGSVYIQLPSTKEKLLSVVHRYENTVVKISEEKWEYFSEFACSYLIKQTLQKLSHSKELDIGNKALNPLNLIHTSILKYPNQREKFIDLLKTQKSFFSKYLQTSEITELFTWSNICKKTNDCYLVAVNNLVIKLLQLEECVDSQTAINTFF